MIRPSLLLSLLTAMFASESESPNTLNTLPKQEVQSVQMVDTILSEEQQIVLDVRRNVGRELCNL